MKKWKETLAVVLTLTLLLTGLDLAADVLRPHRADFGSNWSGFLREPEHSLDVLILGSSMAYCDVIPAALYEETGIKAYLAAGPEQTMPLAYYALRETFRTQSPKTVVLELSAMFYDRYYENSSMINVSYMPWGVNRLAATFHGVPPEDRLGLLLPVLSYHDRWYEITAEEAETNLHPAPDLNAGYTPLSETEPQNGMVPSAYEIDPADYATALTYLRKIAEFCRERDVRLLLYRTPSLRQLAPEVLETLERDLETVPHDGYCDFHTMLDQLKLDDETDWHDVLHLNTAGAEKFTPWFAAFLTGHGVTPQAPGGEELWRQRVAARRP